MNTELSHIDSDYRVELVRKAIHFCSLSIPIGYFFVPRSVALIIFIPLTLAFLLVDVARYYHRPIQEWFYKWFGWLLRKHESDDKKKRLNGASYVLISATICILVFPKIIAITSFAILIICDLTAALVGKRFGKHRFFGKTLEGSLGFFASGVIVILFTPKVGYESTEYAIGMLSVALGTVIESMSVEVDDNLSIPLTVGLALWIMYHYFLPGLNVYSFG